MLRKKKPIKEGGRRMKEVDANIDFLKKKDLSEWTVTNVGAWLEYIGLGRYRDIFFYNEVDGEMLCEVDDDDLLSIPIDKLGHRKKILSRLDGLRGVSRSASSNGSTRESCSSVGDTMSEGSVDSTDTSTYRGFGVKIKCIYEEDIRTVVLEPMETYDQFKLKILEEFGTQKSAKYKDEEGDMVTIRNTDDVRAIIEASQTQRVRVIIFSTRKKESSKKGSKSSKKGSQSPKKDRESDGSLGSVNATEEVLENFVDAVIIANRRGNITFFNRAAENLFNWDREEVIGKNLKVLMPPEVGNLHNSFLRRYKKEGKARIIGKGRRVQGLTCEGEIIDLWITVSESEKSFTATLKSLKSDDEPQDQGPKNKALIMGLDKELCALDDYPESVIVVDKSGSLQYANKVATSELGFEPNTLEGLHIGFICPAISTVDKSLDLLTDFRNGKKGKKTKLLQNSRRNVVCKTSMGKFKAYDAEFTHLKYLDSNLYPIHLHKVDCGDRVAGESKLDIQRDVIGSLIIPGIIISENSLIQGANSACTQLFGFSLSELLGRNVNMLIPPGMTRNNHTEWIHNYAMTGKGMGPDGVSSVVGQGKEVLAMRKDGSIIRILLSVSALLDEDEKILTGVIQFLGEEKEEKQNEYASKLVEQQISVISGLPIPACVITGESKILAFNRGCEELFGYSSREVEQESVVILMPPGEIRARHPEFVQNFVDGKKDKSKSLVVGKGRKVVGRHKDGHNFSSTLSVTETKDGALTLYTGIFSPV